MDEKLVRLENEDKRQDAQDIAWFALWYVVVSIFSCDISIFKLDSATVLNITNILCFRCAIVAAFFGKEACVKGFRLVRNNSHGR